MAPPSEDVDDTRRTYTVVATGAEARAYDFVSPRPKEHRTTIIQSIGHLIKSCLGGGVVSIHATYAICGLWVAVIMNVILGFMVAYLMIVLAQCAQKLYGRTHVNEMSYPEVAEACLQTCQFPKLRKYSRVFRLAPPFKHQDPKKTNIALLKKEAAFYDTRYLVDFTIMIDLFGSCCCYQCLIAEQSKQLVSHYFDVHLGLRIYILILWIPCIVICMILTLKFLAPFSIVADVVILVVAVCTIVYGVSNASQEGRAPTDMKAWKGDVPKTFQFMGGCVFSMEGVGVTLPIENSMINPHKVTLVLIVGMAIVVGMVMTVGFFGYWGWEENVMAPVTTNFPMNWFTLILKIGLPLMVYVTFALNFWVPFKLTWVYIKKYNRRLDMKLKERIYRAIIVTIITLVSAAFPQVVVLMSVIGAFCLSNMGFLYPAFMQLLLEWEDPGLGVMKWRLLRFLAISIFALVLMIVGTVSGIHEIIDILFIKKQDFNEFY